MCAGLNIILREVQDKDFELLKNLRQNEALQHRLMAYPEENCNDASVKDWLKRRKSDVNGAFYVVADASDEAIGFAQITHIHHKGRFCMIGLALRKEVQGKGIGRQVMRALYQKAQSKNLRKIILELRADNYAALKLYEKEGFRLIGHLKDHYDDGRALYDVLIMEKILEGDAI